MASSTLRTLERREISPSSTRRIPSNSNKLCLKTLKYAVQQTINFPSPSPEVWGVVVGAEVGKGEIVLEEVWLGHHPSNHLWGPPVLLRVARVVVDILATFPINYVQGVITFLELTILKPAKRLCPFQKLCSSYSHVKIISLLSQTKIIEKLFSLTNICRWKLKCP